MANVVIEVEERAEAGRNEARRMRKGGRIPAVLYGSGKPVLRLSVDPRSIETVLHSEAGENTLLQLHLKGREAQRHAMLKEYQLDPITGRLMHADFIRIEMSARLTVSVPVRPVGTAPGVKEQGGLLEIVHREIEVECLPADIPEHIQVDVSELRMGEPIRLADLKPAGNYRFVEEPDTVIITVLAPRAEEEVAPAAAATPAEPEVIGKGKKEETPEAAPPERKPEKK